jgi:photosystem II stability/assembly factor-like uncharacterized protein
VWGSATDDVWVVGGGGNVIHWNGSTWTCVSLTAYWLNGISGSGPQNVFLVGSNGAIYGMQPMAMATNG